MRHKKNQYFDLNQLKPLRELAERTAESNQGIIDVLDLFMEKQSMINRLINLNDEKKPKGDE